MEIVYKDEKKQTEDKKIDILPKNIRQIGEPDQKMRVYLEDFASTYLQKSQTYKPELTKVCMLYGREKEKNGHPVLFIQSAARIELCGKMTEDGVLEPDWKATEGIRRKFFPDQKLLGWSVIAGTEGRMTLEQAKSMHRHRFTGSCQVLFWSDGAEKEEFWFTMGNGELTKLNGYYIYYEENRSMQEYMISHNPTDMDRVGEPEDKAVKDFRQVVERKHAGGEKRAGQVMRIAAAACVVLAIAGGIRVAGRQAGKNVGQTAATLVRQQWEQEADSTAKEMTESTVSTATVQTDSSLTEEVIPEETSTVETSAAATDGAGVQTEEMKIAGADVQLMGSDVTTETSAEIKTEESAKTGENSPTTDSPVPEELTTDPADSVTESQTEETATAGYRTYQVKTGDTISSISQRYYGSMSKVREICELNRIEQQDLIYSGQILLLP